ncbi:MAG TPA: AmmeMemoRadiSam system radical SAM enzyme [Vicinamibacterales bacterium]|jgi:pyruvate formate lyase activating enzyme
MFSRRQLLITAARSLPLSIVPPWSSLVAGAGWTPNAVRARYWTTAALAGAECRLCHDQPLRPDAVHQHVRTTVRCLLCAQRCTIVAGQAGKCRARTNVRGELRTLVYGYPLAVHIDPIEKKPFYHFLPGSSALSLGTAGCPLRCKFCQNWELSQSTPGDVESQYVAPEELVRTAETRRTPVIAFTYNEPTVFIEYVLDVAGQARARGIHAVMVSCGFANEVPLADVCGALSAIKIDLKGFSEEFYRNVCGAELQPVLRSIKQIAKSGRHLELVNLVVPTLNDSDKALMGLAAWVAGELGPDVPVHFTRFHPDYQLRNLPPTPVATLERARQMARDKGIHYAYVGNVPGHPGNHTYCPKCQEAVIRRDNFFVTETHIRDGRCEYCKQAIAGVWA